MKFHVKGTIRPPRGTPGANGTYTVDLEIETPQRVARLVTLAGHVLGNAGNVPHDVRHYFEVALERAMRDAGRTEE